MSLSRMSDTESNKFEELARSQPEFENTGQVTALIGNSINPKKYTTDRLASGVYIGDRMAITSADSLPLSLKDGVFASSMKYQTYFVTKDADGTIHSARVLMAMRHPEFKQNHSLKNLRNDIAILVLDHEFKYLKPVPVNLKFIKNPLKNCVHVGYSTEKISSLPLDNKRQPREYYPTSVRVGVKFPSLTYVPYAKLHMASLGSSFYKNDSLFCNTIQYQLVRKHDYDPLESGSTNQMLGGGYFIKDTLVGVIVATLRPKFTGQGSFLPLDEVLGVPLFEHKEWIENTIAENQALLPALMLRNKQWEKEYKQYERTQDEIRAFVALDPKDREHEAQPIKKIKLDELAKKIGELHARGNQELRTNALYKIYDAFKTLNLDNEISLKSYYSTYKENIDVLNDFDKTGIKRFVGSLFKSTTDTYQLMIGLNDFIEKHNLPSERVKYQCRYD